MFISEKNCCMGDKTLLMKLSFDLIFTIDVTFKININYAGDVINMCFPCRDKS